MEEMKNSLLFYNNLQEKEIIIDLEVISNVNCCLEMFDYKVSDDKMLNLYLDIKHKYLFNDYICLDNYDELIEIIKGLGY